MKRLSVTFCIIVCLLLFGACSIRSNGIKSTHEKVNVNGVSLYYETAGTGKPVILVSGNGGSHDDLYMEMEQLVKAGYQVYGIDSRGQGHNEPLAEYHYEDMAEDMYQFIQELQLEKPAFYGWSDGGIIGIILSIRHPDALSLLCGSGANISPEGLNLDTSEVSSIQDPLTRMVYTEPSLDPTDLRAITIPVLLTAGEHDLIKEDHTRMMAEHIKETELQILSGETHGSYIGGSKIMGELLISFFKKHNY